MPANKKWFPLLIVILAWFALIAQFYLIILNRTVPVTETIIKYFSFFTIPTNLLVALSFSFFLSKQKSRLANFFSRPTTLTAVTVYIFVVGIVYTLSFVFYGSQNDCN